MRLDYAPSQKKPLTLSRDRFVNAEMDASFTRVLSGNGDSLITMNWQTLKIVGGYAVSLVVGWRGFSEMIRWWTTGELIGSFRRSAEPSSLRLITYDSDPLNFVFFFAIDAMFTAVGVAACVAAASRVREWWVVK